MATEHLTISLNEVLFFFTRAGFGVNAPIGISEDFAYSNMWIAENGFDPSSCSIEALNNLDSHASDLAVELEKSDTQVHFVNPNNVYLSSLIASVSVVDCINIESQGVELIVKNVD